MKKFNKYTAIIIFLALISCKTKQEDIKDNTEDQKQELHYITLTKKQFSHNNMEMKYPELNIFDNTISLNGKTQVPPNDRAFLMSYSGGYVKYIYKQRGESVHKGENIASIESPYFIVLQKEYIEISQELEILKTELERQNTLYEEKIAAKKTLERSQTDYQNQLIRKKSLEKELQLYGFSPKEVSNGNLNSIAYLKAPISGLIEEINVQLGQYISAEEQIASIINTKNMHLELQAFEKDWHGLEIGQEIYFSLPNASNEKHKASVEYIGKQINSETNTIIIQGKILDKVSNLVPGIFINALIKTHNQEILALPEDAFVANEGTYYILQLEKEDENAYYFKPIKVTITAETATHKSFLDIENKNEKKFLTKGAFNIMEFEEN
ncbi:MAG TPA: efflux RND transporter periplasmic adaptor subunit [Chitinophagaceae bacterium]|nr:efflux RND transporter periplasmic adaptor subunit [Chitinophagaceae bacterium]